MSWFRLPLYFGTLKIKSRRHLRREEMHGRVPVLKIGRTYFVWKPRASRKRPTHITEKPGGA